MRQRLDDDAFAINENDVSVPKDLDIEGSLAVFGVKPEGKNTIKSNLLNRFEPCIAKVLSEHHCKRGASWASDGLVARCKFAPLEQRPRPVVLHLWG